MNLVFALMFAVLPPCETEDATNCHWQAPPNGNSFVDVGGTAFYLDSTKPPVTGLY